MCPQFIALNNTIMFKIIYGKVLFKIVRTICISRIFLSRFFSKSKVLVLHCTIVGNLNYEYKYIFFCPIFCIIYIILLLLILIDRKN